MTTARARVHEFRDGTLAYGFEYRHRATGELLIPMGGFRPHGDSVGCVVCRSPAAPKKVNGHPVPLRKLKLVWEWEEFAAAFAPAWSDDDQGVLPL